MVVLVASYEAPDAPRTSSCAAELLCENGICVISPLEGEPCSANGECAEGLECGDSNVCAPPEPLVCDLLSDG